jgi:hypothetical protein
MSDYIKLTRHGKEFHVHAWRVNGVFASGDDKGSIILLPGGSWEVEESPGDIVAMLDETVNGPETGPITVPNFPGMEK